MRIFAAALLAAILPSQDAGPFASRRESSPNGRHYADLRSPGVPPTVSYELRRRRPGAGTDEVVASGTLPQAPFQVRVLDGEPALVLFEKHGGIGTGDALALLGPDGKFRWRLRLADLFRAEALKSFPVEGGNTWWFEAWWVDEARGTVVLCAVGDHIGEVALADGKVRKADPAVLLARAAAGPAEERAAAMEIAARLRPEGTADLAKRIAADPKEPLALRVRAAAAVRRTGGTMEFAPLLRAACARDADPSARTYAASILPEILGDGALPLLRELLRGEADASWRPALASLASLGDKAVPVLVEMLGEKDQSLDYRGGAAAALGAVKAPSALPALWKAALDFDPEGDPHHFVPQSALEAWAAAEPPDLRARLIGILDSGTPHDGRVAKWIEDHPGKDALPALEKALARWEKGEYGKFGWEYRRIAAAIRACGG